MPSLMVLRDFEEKNVEKNHVAKHEKEQEFWCKYIEVWSGTAGIFSIRCIIYLWNLSLC